MFFTLMKKKKKILMEAFLTMDLYKKHIGFEWIELRVKISICYTFFKAGVKNKRSRWDDTRT